MGKWANGQMGKWANGQMGKWQEKERGDRESKSECHSDPPFSISSLYLLGIIAIYALFQARHLGGFQWNDDEGLILMGSWLMRQGYSLYTQLWWEQPPLFFLEIIGAFQLFGVSVTAGRLVALGHALLGLMAVGGISYALTARWTSAIGSVVLLAIAPDFFWQSRAVVRTLPAISLITCALAFIIFYYRYRRYLLLILSAVFTALALLTKFNVVPTLVPIGLTILLASRARQQGRSALCPYKLRLAIIDGAMFAVVVIAVMLVVFIPFDLLRFLQINFVAYFRARQRIPLNIALNARVITQYLLDNLHITAPATFALLAYLPIRPFAHLRICKFAYLLICVVWVLSNALFLLFHTPLWFPLVIALLPGLAVLAGYGLSILGELLPIRAFVCFRVPSCAFVCLRGLICLFAYLLICAGGWRALRQDYTLLAAPSLPEHLAATAWLETETTPADFVITDAPMVAFRAQRRVPPETCNNSRKRIESELLTSADMISYTTTYKPAAVIVWHHFRLRTTKSYLDWLSCYYHSVQRWPLLETFAPFTLPSNFHSTDVYLTEQTAPQIRLRGYDLSPLSPQISAGDTITLTLYWQAAAPIAGDYTVFVHAVAPDGQRWGQHDGDPRHGACPTTTWAPGYLLVDEHPVPISPDTPTGPLTIRVGLYDRQTLQRLAMFTADGRRVPEDSIALTEILVEKQQ